MSKVTWTKIDNPQLKDCKGRLIRVGQHVVYNAGGDLNDGVVESLSHKTKTVPYTGTYTHTYNRYLIKLESGTKITNPGSVYILEEL